MIDFNTGRILLKYLSRETVLILIELYSLLYIARMIYRLNLFVYSSRYEIFYVLLIYEVLNLYILGKLMLKCTRIYILLINSEI